MRGKVGKKDRLRFWGYWFVKSLDVCVRGMPFNIGWRVFFYSYI